MIDKTGDKLRDKLRAAVDKLGGSRRVSRLTNIPRSSIDYWCHLNISDKSRPNAERIIELARDESQHHHVGATRPPPWALTLLKQRE